MRRPTVTLALLAALAATSCGDSPAAPPRRIEPSESPPGRRREVSEQGVATAARLRPRPRHVSVDLDALRRLGAAEIDDDISADDVARAIWKARGVVVPILVEALRSGDGVAARGTQFGFDIVPREGLPALVALLNDPDDRVRAHSVSCLLRLQDWWGVDPSRDSVIDTVLAGIKLGGVNERRHRFEILRAAGRTDARVVEAVRPLLATATGHELKWMAEFTGALGPAGRTLAPELLARLDGTARDGPPSERDALVRALGAVGPPDPSFVLALGHRLAVPQDADDVLSVLADWGEQAAPARAAIADLSASGNAKMRDLALSVLVTLPGGALPAVRAAVADFAANAPRPDSTQTLRLLDDLGPRCADVLPWLGETLRTGPVEERAAAARALGLLSPAVAARARSLLIEAFASEDSRVRECVAWSLFWPPSERPHDVELFAQALSDSCGEVRRVALMASAWPYKGTHDEEAAKRVGKFLSDPDPGVRFWAGNLIEDIGAPPAPEAVTAIRTNLRSPDRLVRLGALRAAAMLGPDAAPAIPELLVIARDEDLGGWALAALAATGRLDSSLTAQILSVVSKNRWLLTQALAAFGPRGSFLEDLGRTVALDGRPWNGLTELAGATSDRREFASWLVSHRQRLGGNEYPTALRSLGPAGLRGLVAWTVGKRVFATVALREHVRAIGPPAAEALVEIAHDASAAEALLATRVLLDVLPEHAGTVLHECLGSTDPQIRAMALHAVRSGAGRSDVAAAVQRGLRDVPVVRAAALDLIAADPAVAPVAVSTVRDALDDEDPDVRVAAAGALFALTQDAAAVLPVLRAELNLPAPWIVWGRFGRSPERPQDAYDAKDRRWVAVARVLAAMGPSGAPAAEDLVWAALRHDDPGVQYRMIGALEAMGPAARSVSRLAGRLHVSDEFEAGLNFGDDPARLAETVDRVLKAIDG